ncbi:MAG: RNA polymerase subunit sigma-70 [Intrasporangiaceae bacterium]|nr:RNA polymerase subunit sigma-70 [Intrasporangiaceae bacterium]
MREPQELFVEVFEATYVDIVRFAARRIDPSRAEDIAAEAFAVAWRRLDALPDELGQARAWLFGITRKLLLAQHRQANGVLLVELVHDVGVDGHEESVAGITDLVAAWQRLRPVHQESISLTAWDGLTGAEAAAVLGISPIAYRIRLTRARRALRALLESSPPATIHHPATVQEGTR